MAGAQSRRPRGEPARGRGLRGDPREADLDRRSHDPDNRPRGLGTSFNGGRHVTHLDLVPSDSEGAPTARNEGLRDASGIVAATDAIDPHFINRELSMLQFNWRVLNQALDPAVPLLERLRFLTISSTNLDEFFEIRVSRLQQQVAFGLSSVGADSLSSQELLARISAEAHRLVAEQYRALSAVVLPALSTAGIRLRNPTTWTGAQEAWIHAYFQREVLPVLTPIGLDPAHPFPHVQNKNLNLLVSLDGADAFGRRSGIAVVQVPRALPRVLMVPAVGAGLGRPWAQEARGVNALEDSAARDFVLLSHVIQRHLAELFPGMAVLGYVPFRVTRDSDLWLAEEETDDLLQALKGELHRRNDGDAVRLEVSDTCTPEMAQFLLSQFDLGEADLYRVSGPVNLHRLAALCDLAERPDLRFPPHLPRPPRDLGQKTDLFERIRRSDLLLHHPYESAGPVLELLRQAALDPDVLGVKQTLYRTGKDSPFAQGLIDAARAGKDVTAVVELRARFDEAANIALATALQAAGANVVYGVVGFKTHAKMLLVVRREAGGIRRYVHLGTGNYHPQTARIYTDLSLLTADPVLGEDVHKIFQQLTGLGTVRRLDKLLHAPFTLHAEIVALIDAETEAAKAGKPARILAKMNALSEPQVIAALYRASQAGVEIDLIVRGICCLRPGVPGLSERIRVRSIVGRFLEHARVFCFHAGGQDRVWASSADWMERNFSRRVETAFAIENKEFKARVLQEFLTGPLKDNTQAWLLQPDGCYERMLPGDEPVFSIQEFLARQPAVEVVAGLREA